MREQKVPELSKKPIAELLFAEYFSPWTEFTLLPPHSSPMYQPKAEAA